MMPIKRHVIIHIDFHALYLRKFIAPPRQGSKLRLIEPHESPPSIPRQFLERIEVQFTQQLSNRVVQFTRRSKTAMPKTRQNPALHH